jgi:hypothetical protein
MATATIQVAYEAETTSLKATVNEINQINDKVVQGAQESASKVKKEYTGIANSFAAAFSGGEVKKALDNQAKAIDNVGKSGKSLTGQLRGLKQELAQLEIAGQDGTDAFNKLLIAASKLEDQIGDTRARVKILASDTFKFDAAVGATQALASGFELAQGAAALFGEENEDLQQALVKITAATAVANSVQQLSALIKEENAVKTAVLAARTSALTVATGAYNVVVGTTTGLMKALRIAFAATGVGALVIGLGFLIENFDKVKEFAFKAIPGLEGFTKTVGKVIDETKRLLGFEDPKQQENIFEKLVTLENRKVKAKENAINRRIDLLKAENKDTSALEIEREQLLLNFANKKKTVIEANAASIKAAGLDASETLFDLEQEILDRESAIQVIRVENRRVALAQVVELETKAFKGIIKVKEQELKLNEDVSTAFQDGINENNKTRVAALELEIADGDKSLETRIKLIQAKAKAESDALGLTEADSLKRQKIAKDTEAAITDETNKETQKRIDLAFQYAAAVTSLFGELNELSKQATEERVAEIQETSDKELEAINASTALERDKERQRVALAKRTAAAISAEKTQQAKQDKALALFNIGVSTAEAIIKFLANPGGTAGVALSIIAGITGAAQLAAVASKPIPKFERGGVVGGRLHSGGGTMVEAERDEYIVNRRQSIRHRSELDAINSSSDAFRKLIEQRYVRPALMDYVAGNRNKQGVTVNASLNSKSMEKELRGMRKDLSKRNMTININQQDSRYLWQ